MYEITDVADYVVGYMNDKNREITNLRLQKLLYFIQAQFLMLKGEPCFKQNLEAGILGPNNYEVFEKYIPYGTGSIPYDVVTPHDDFEDEDCLLIDDTIESCEELSTAELTDISMKQDPWMKSYSLGVKHPIDNELIRRFFCP